MNDGDAEEVKVGDAPELLEQVDGQEGPQRVLGRNDAVVDVLARLQPLADQHRALLVRRRSAADGRLLALLRPAETEPNKTKAIRYGHHSIHSSELKRIPCRVFKLIS